MLFDKFYKYFDIHFYLCLYILSFAFTGFASPALCSNKIASAIKFISNTEIDIYHREQRLEKITSHCQVNKVAPSLVPAVTNFNNDMEWFLREKIITWVTKNNRQCSKDIVDYLLSAIFKKNEDYYIREAMIWAVADTTHAKGQSIKLCDGKVISVFSNFIQTEQHKLNDLELADFRTRMIMPLLLSMVRLGIRNHTDTPADALKTIALNHSVNTYFRIIALEALQGFSVYRKSGVQYLKNIIKEIDKRHIKKPTALINDDELELNNNDSNVKQHAILLLNDLQFRPQLNFLTLMSDSQERLNKHTHQFEWQKALRHLPKPPLQ